MPHPTRPDHRPALPRLLLRHGQQAPRHRPRGPGAGRPRRRRRTGPTSRCASSTASTSATAATSWSCAGPGRPARERDTWLGGVLGDRATRALAGWLEDGAPEPVPAPLAGHRFRHLPPRPVEPAAADAGRLSRARAPARSPSPAGRSARGGAAKLSSGVGSAYFCRVIALARVNSLSPSSPWMRPKPESPTPPKGRPGTDANAMTELTLVMPGAHAPRDVHAAGPCCR